MCCYTLVNLKVDSLNKMKIKKCSFTCIIIKEVDRHITVYSSSSSSR